LTAVIKRIAALVAAVFGQKSDEAVFGNNWLGIALALASGRTAVDGGAPPA